MGKDIRMAYKGMDNLIQLHRDKIRRRADEIRGYIHAEPVPVTDVAVYETMDHLTPEEAAGREYTPVSLGFRWGESWSTTWFRVRFTVPAAFAGETVVLRFDPQGESVVFQDGVPVQGLDANRTDLIVLERAKGGEAFELYVESGCNDAFGRYVKRELAQAEVAILLREVWDCYYDVHALHDFLSDRPYEDTRAARITHELSKALDTFDYQNLTREGLRASANRVREAIAPLYAQGAHASAQTLACVGHAHIDVAWLWPLRETIRKCVRTFSTAVKYMDEYPEYIFAQSQPHLYEFTRDHYPALYERIKEKVRTGQWQPVGCMWVEADCNVPSGESLVRQILFGTRFFKQEFATDIECLWLPDVFGYSAALPQLLRRSGLKYFTTQKISWCQFTRFPYHTFMWEGIDGTEILTHFPPVDTYNCSLDAKQVLFAERNYREKDRSSFQLHQYGFGDGGGGPTKTHIEKIRRYGDFEGMPRTMSISPKDFFHRLEADARDLPMWVGEIYLELHRGTLTTQAYNKRNNRKSELLYRDAEMLSALGMAFGGTYRQEDLNAGWKTILLNQFHDILPGSSISLVYEDCDRDYARVREIGEDVRRSALAYYEELVDTAGEGRPVLAFNSLSWDREEAIEVDAADLEPGTAYVAVGPDGEERPVQVSEGTARFTGRVPAIGHAVFKLQPAAGEPSGKTVNASASGMENEYLRITFDENGLISSLYDKENGREVVAEGERANQFMLFEDKPANWDAWDMDIFYTEKGERVTGLDSIEVAEEGPVRSVVRMKRSFSRSTMVQDVILHAGARRVDFRTEVLWGDEKDTMLKVAFPVEILSPKATYEIQFGNVERPTHWNRPSDFGQFEVVGHKWADLSEGDYGVALLNDCKYGHDIKGNVMRLTLLRSPKVPDPTADVNKTHLFTYSILPHRGDYRNGVVVRRGYELNVPVIARAVDPSPGQLGPYGSLMSVSVENILLDTVKKAEDDGGIIVRMYEAHQCRSACTFTTSLPIQSAVETDLMEREERALEIRDGKIELHFHPFEIKTIKLLDTDC